MDCYRLNWIFESKHLASNISRIYSWISSALAVVAARTEAESLTKLLDRGDRMLLVRVFFFSFLMFYLLTVVLSVFKMDVIGLVYLCLIVLENWEFLI